MSKYHEKFRDWKVGQAWIVKRTDGILKEIRTACSLKRRKIQSKIRCRRVKAKLLAKHRDRERNRVLDIYHKIANEIVKNRTENEFGNSLRKPSKKLVKKINYSKELNERLHR